MYKAIKYIIKNLHLYLTTTNTSSITKPDKYYTIYISFYDMLQFSVMCQSVYRAHHCGVLESIQHTWGEK